MTIFFDAPVAPDALTAFVREVPLPSGNSLTAAFPSRTHDNNTVDFSEIVRTNRAAKYRSFDGRIHVSERDAGSDKRVKLAPLSSSIGLGEYERLQLEFARTGGTNRGALANSVYNDGENMTREILNRLELAWGDVLTDGKLTINENGFQGEADYGVPAAHTPTAGTSWANTASAPAFDNIVAWADAYNNTNGFLPATMLTSLRVQRLLQTNQQIINMVHGSAAGKSRVNLGDLNDMLSSEGLPTLQSTYGTRIEVDGVSTPVIADDRLVFLPPNLADLGHTAWGISATALELVNDSRSSLTFAQAGGIVGVVIKDGPPFRQFTFVDAVGMPVLDDGRKLLTADVIA